MAFSRMDSWFGRDEGAISDIINPSGKYSIASVCEMDALLVILVAKAANELGVIPDDSKSVI